MTWRPPELTSVLPPRRLSASIEPSPSSTTGSRPLYQCSRGPAPLLLPSGCLSVSVLMCQPFDDRKAGGVCAHSFLRVHLILCRSNVSSCLKNVSGLESSAIVLHFAIKPVLHRSLCSVCGDVFRYSDQLVPFCPPGNTVFFWPKRRQRLGTLSWRNGAYDPTAKLIL